MTSACDVYKGAKRLGSGTCAADSVTISSYTANNNGGLAGDVAGIALRKNVRIVITAAGTHVGRHWDTYCSAAGATLTLRDPCPFVGA